MPNLLIRDISEDTVKTLKEMAKRDGRSLQQELRLAIERFAGQPSYDPMEAADRIRRKLEMEYGKFPDSAQIIREGRER